MEFLFEYFASIVVLCSSSLYPNAIVIIKISVLCGWPRVSYWELVMVEDVVCFHCLLNMQQVVYYFMKMSIN